MATATWINRDRLKQPLTLAEIVRQARLQFENLGVVWRYDEDVGSAAARARPN